MALDRVFVKKEYVFLAVDVLCKHLFVFIGIKINFIAGSVLLQLLLKI